MPAGAELALQFGESLPRARLTAGGGVVLAEDCLLQFVHAAASAEDTADPGEGPRCLGSTAWSRGETWLATYKRAASRNSALKLRSCACADRTICSWSSRGNCAETMLFSDPLGNATTKLFGYELERFHCQQWLQQ